MARRKVPYFSARLDFLSPPLSAPGSPRMKKHCNLKKKERRKQYTTIKSSKNDFYKLVERTSRITLILIETNLRNAKKFTCIQNIYRKFDKGIKVSIKLKSMTIGTN